MGEWSQALLARERYGCPQGREMGDDRWSAEQVVPLLVQEVPEAGEALSVGPEGWRRVRSQIAVLQPGIDERLKRWLVACTFCLLIGITENAQQERKQGLCCKNSQRNTMGGKTHFLFSLGGHSEQASDERNLMCDVPFFHPMHLPLAKHVHTLVSMSRVPGSLKRKEIQP